MTHTNKAQCSVESLTSMRTKFLQIRSLWSRAIFGFGHFYELAKGAQYDFVFDSKNRLLKSIIRYNERLTMKSYTVLRHINGGSNFETVQSGRMRRRTEWRVVDSCLWWKCHKGTHAAAHIIPVAQELNVGKSHLEVTRLLKRRIRRIWPKYRAIRACGLFCEHFCQRNTSSNA